MKWVLIAVGIAVSTVVVAAALLLIPAPADPEPPKPAPVRYMPTAQLKRELSPSIGQASIGGGFICDVYESQRLKRLVLVCT